LLDSKAGEIREIEMCTSVRSLTIWRDSVHPGDDFDAPHETSLPISTGETIESVVTRVASSSYLASIHGGEATWIVYSGRHPLAVVAQQWQAPRFLAAPEQSITSVISQDDECHLEFRYWCQADPDLVFECLQHNKPLPSKNR
jgi:hypothetical protein